ncbi:hypothetical protein A6R68_11613 [Neotoma lepida]|uniref:Centrosomal protein of 19 kDa n=1 Tax=Neotoma lepida TaxID=56216 RepID=A0A1A6FUL9_NEOLE|nr:hypothetical protein A6R68_11613 [Neotoma lepida]
MVIPVGYGCRLFLQRQAPLLLKADVSAPLCNAVGWTQPSHCCSDVHFLYFFKDCTRAAEQLKNNARHKSYLEQVSLKQLEKLFVFLRGYLRGQSLAETIEQIQRETTIDPEEDLNKLDDKELAKRKSIMDELFEKNQKRKDDPSFVYDVEVEFPQDEQLLSCSWDTESVDEF